MSQISCDCYYCKHHFSQEDITTFVQTFVKDVVTHIVPQLRGFMSTSDNRELLESFSSEFELMMSDSPPDEPEDSGRRYLLSEFSYTFNTGADFADAYRTLMRLCDFINRSLVTDRLSAAMPLYTKIITPEVFVQTFLSGQLPTEIAKKIDQIEKAAEQADFITTTKQ